MRELIELSFVVVSMVGPSIGVLDGGRHAARGRMVLGKGCGVSPYLFQWRIVK